MKFEQISADGRQPPEVDTACPLVDPEIDSFTAALRAEAGTDLQKTRDSTSHRQARAASNEVTDEEDVSFTVGRRRGAYHISPEKSDTELGDLLSDRADQDELGYGKAEEDSDELPEAPISDEEGLDF